MELIHFKNQNYHYLGGIALALGEFDGLHRAHQSLIGETVKYARENKLKAGVLTFEPHPDFVLKKRPYQGYITPLSEKVRAMAALGVDYLFVVNFTPEFARLSPEKFEREVLGRLDIRKIFVGFDYRYGLRGAGNPASLQEKYPVLVLDKIIHNEKKIGSSIIRSLLASGKTEEAAALLGRHYSITGRVIPGDGVGKKIGFPTANIEMAGDYHFLKEGVYAVIITVRGKKHAGVCNLGHNPTLNYVERPRLEVHILDFDEDIYGEEIAVDFVKYLRPEIKYSGPEALLMQIRKDIAQAAKILEEA